MTHFCVFTDYNIDAPPSLKPAKKYSDISGLPVSNYLIQIHIVQPKAIPNIIKSIDILSLSSSLLSSHIEDLLFLFRQTTQTRRPSYVSHPRRSFPTSAYSQPMLSLATWRSERPLALCLDNPANSTIGGQYYS